MDAVEFIKTRNQICKKNDCSNCPIVEFDLCGYDEDVEKIVSIVENWKKEHPAKIRQDEFLKLHPNAARRNGLLDICPKNIDINFKCPFVDVLDCYKCKDIYWSKEVE